MFTRRLADYLDDDSYLLLQQTLIRNPPIGALIPETGGFRKLRWEDIRRQKGKRGGLRVVYYHLARTDQVWFFTIYDKGEVSDLTSAQRRQLRTAIQTELKARGEQ